MAGREATDSHAHVIVMGAGVIGLTCAVTLADAGHDVTVIAAHVPGDEDIEYTSPWAGGHWRSHASPDEHREADWDVQTYDHWLELLEREARNASLFKSGIKMYDQFHFWDRPPTESLWWAPHVHNFRALSPAQEPLKSVNQKQPLGTPRAEHGAACRAMAINVPRYLRYLQNRLESAGGRLIKARLPTDSGFAKVLDTAEEIACQKADCFVNATGLGAAAVCGDKGMFPIRGQTVLVKGEASAIRIRYGDGYTAYCLPRAGSGTTILGGTRQVNDWTAAAVPETTQEILERCSWMVPELQTGPDGTFEVISSQCGLRPARKGGARVERETVGDHKVVHAYGHAGAGYQNSIGCAREVLGLVRGGLAVTSRL